MITNNFLNETAKALAGESYVVPTFMAFGSTVITPNAASTVVTGEIGDRYALSDSRSNAIVTWSGIRTGADVATSSGDTLNAIYMLSASTGGTLFSENTLSSIIHTTAFDIAVDYAVTVSRG